MNLYGLLLNLSQKGFRSLKQTNDYIFPVNWKLLIAVCHSQQSLKKTSLKKTEGVFAFYSLTLVAIRSCAWIQTGESDNFSCGFVKYFDATLTFYVIEKD